MSKPLRTHIKQILFILAVIMPTARADVAEKTEIVELAKALWGQSSPTEASDETPNLTILPPGTLAKIDDIHNLKDPNSHGLCLKIIKTKTEQNLNENCYWVHYNSNEKNLGFSEPDLLKMQKQHLTVTVNADTPALQGPPVPKSPTPDLLSLSVVQTVSTLNNISSNLDPKANLDPCNDCTLNTPKISSFQNCNSKNDYFEKEFDSVFKPNDPIHHMFTKNAPPKYIKDSCFIGALTTFSGPYKYCRAGSKGKPQKSVPAACISERYSRLVRNSFDTIGDCLGDYLSGRAENSKAGMINMFGLMSVESGLHINARSPEILKDKKIVAGGAGGTGQLTGDAIRAVNKNELKLMRKHLEGKDAPECKMLLQVLEDPMSDSLEESCSRISLSNGNPLKNMMYTLAFQKQARFSIRRLALENPVAKSALSNLSKKQKVQLEAELALWAHNSGNGALSKALHRYLKLLNMLSAKYRPSNITSFMRGLQDYLQGTAANRHNIEEPVKFWNRIHNRMSELDTNMGQGTCAVKSI